MSLWCLQLSLCSIRLWIWEEMLFEEFQDGYSGDYLGYGNITILAILNMYVIPMPPIKFRLNQFTVWEMSLDEFQDGSRCSHLWYIETNGTISAILNLYAAQMPPIKFLLNPTYDVGGDEIWKILSWPPWRPSWISERNNFSNSESLFHSDASHSFGSLWLAVWRISRWSPWRPS